MGIGRLAGTVAFLVALGLALPAVDAQVVINELAYDDTGTDDEEFVELFNGGTEAVDLSDWRLETGDGVAPAVILTLPEGTMIEAGAYVVVGGSFVPTAIGSWGEETLGNGPAYVLLVDADGLTVDRVAYEANKGLAGFPAAAIEEGAIWGNHVLVDTTRMSWQRWLDGRDTDSNAADFGHLPWTPGGTNNRSSPPVFSSGFDDGWPEDPVEELVGTFVPGRVIDPLVPTLSNPSALPESPDGGLALVAWDPAGGGNLVVLEAEPVAALQFEAWVYLDATPELAGESETWSMGLGGTSGTYYNIPILFDANGNTGVTWTYQVTAAGATLYLIDEGEGGPAAQRVHLGSVPIVRGENDGWQRLRLEVTEDRAVGHFGGDFGATDDGVRIDGPIRSLGIGSFYIGYREALEDNATARPPTIDSLEIGPPDSTLALFARGNSNADDATNLSDSVFLLNHLFLGGPAPPCLDAADADDDGLLNLTDAIYVLNHLFLGGSEPAAPFPGCGEDPTPDALPCDQPHPACLAAPP